MRYVHDGNVRSLVSRFGPLDSAQAWSIIAQVASALDAAHAHGLIHRDVKPASMLVDASSAEDSSTAYQAGRGDGAHVYLSDFGMGMNPPPGDSRATGQFAGTLDYVAPEQIRGRALDGRADLYSLACAGFELLCGTPPFAQDQGLTVMYDQLYVPPPQATARRPDLPAAVDEVLATALAKDPADRYATCGQFAEELQSALGLRPVRSRPSRPAGPPAPARPWGSEGRAHPHEPAPAPTPPAARPDPESGPAGRDHAPPGQRPGRDHAPPGQRPGRDPAPPGQRPGRVRLIVAVAAVAITAAAVAIGIGVAHTSRPAPAAPTTPATSAPPATPATPATSAVSSPAASSTPSVSASVLASRQAAAVSNLLGSSTATRQALESAVTQIQACTNLSGAVSQIQNVVDQRSSQYERASALPTAALASGATLKSDLITALRDSLNADRDYLTWARQQLTSGCTPGAQSSAYNTAYAADQQANAAKAQFALAWDPVAARYGVSQQSADSI
jgi:serine/threonine protein kinase